MKKTILIVALVVLALGALGVGIAFAQDENPPIGPGMMGGGFGPMHSYVVAALAEKLDLSVDEVNSQLAGGKTMYQIALDNGIAEDEIASFLTEVHTAAFDKAVADGVLSREQADLMLQRMQSMWQNGFGPGNCPMQSGQFGQPGQTYGPGMMQNWQGNGGFGMMRGWRWQNP
jgi:hypothetical protein